MRLLWLELRDFRSYAALRFQPEAGVNLLVGPNAAGKTNLLEAIAYLSSLRSFRGVPERTLVREGADRVVVRGEIGRLAGTTLIEVEFPREGRRRAQVNRQALRRTADLLGQARAVAFLPDDLDLVKRGPAHRRGLLDDLAVQMWPAAHLDQAEYERTLRQRNSLLRQWGREAEDRALDVWDERLAAAGARVVERRRGSVEALQARMSQAYQEIAGLEEEVTVLYESDWDGFSEEDEEASRRRLLDALRTARREDQERRVTTVGPHRDAPQLVIGGRDSRTLASQGEQRSLVLAIRLATHRAVEAQVGEPPILLLDDVFSELDENRAKALLDVLPNAQTLVTSARPEEIPLSGRRWTVERGRVR